MSKNEGYNRNVLEYEQYYVIKKQIPIDMMRVFQGKKYINNFRFLYFYIQYRYKIKNYNRDKRKIENKFDTIHYNE